MTPQLTKCDLPSDFSMTRMIEPPWDDWARGDVIARQLLHDDLGRYQDLPGLAPEILADDQTGCPWL
jgi:hypothetical protein